MDKGEIRIDSLNGKTDWKVGKRGEYQSGDN